MKKILALLLIGVMLVLAGCDGKEENPESGSKTEITYSLPSIDADDVEVEESEYERFSNSLWEIDRLTPTFFERPETELTVKVKITKYCGRLFGDDSDVGLFVAKVLTCYKGDAKPGDDINIMQYFVDYPLFAISDVMLLNLRHFTNDDIKIDDNIFDIVGSRFGIVDITKYNGIEYAVNRGMEDYFEELDTTPVDDAMRESVLNTYYEQDPVRESTGPVNQVYVYKDLEKDIIDHNFNAKSR